ncbi:MAG: ATP-binding protein [Candidatus Methylomirabilales bacterium]
MPAPGSPPAVPLETAAARVQRERDLYAQSLAEMVQRYEQKIQELSLLRRLSEVLRDSAGVEEVVRRLLGIVQEELGVPASSLYLADDSGELVLRARGQDGLIEILTPGSRAALRVAAGAGPLGRTFATGQMVEERAVPEGTPGWFPPEARRLLAAPLGACIGVVALHLADTDEALPDGPRLLPILAMQATIALENAALYRRLKQHADTLEIRVRERTAALEHLNAELQAAARQRSEFFAHFSHELRTPLNSILGFSDMLRSGRQGPLSEAQRRSVGHVHDSGARLLRLINDILDLAKVEAGRLSLRVAPVTLRLAVDEALAVMQPQAGAKHLTLTRRLPADLPPVQADAGRLHQVLLNLLSNAVKFTPEGGRITVEARGVPIADVGLQIGATPVDRGREMAASTSEISGPRSALQRAEPRADGDPRDPVPESAISDRKPAIAFVEVAVVDSGIGIAPEDQARLFRDFEQVGAGGAGTGLGLSLSRRLVGLHGGRMGVESVPGRGSRFWFTLPVAQPVA